MYWNKEFESYNLTKNMRLLGITENANIDLTQQQHLFLNNERCYGEMILKIGEGRLKGSNYESENLDLGTFLSQMWNVSPNRKKAYNICIQMGLTQKILACTNTQVDEWNNIIQCMNPSFHIHGDRRYCLSKDISAEVDDPYDILKEISEVLSTFIKN